MVLSRQNVECKVSWPWQIRHTGKGSDIVIQVKSTSFRLHKVFLENGSSHFEKLFAAMAAECGSMQAPTTVDMAAFPCNADTFSIAMDYCYGKTDHVITESNIEELIAANNFLQVGILSTKIRNFLEQNVFVSPEKCLQFFSRLQDKTVKGALSNECKTAFIAKIQAPGVFGSSDAPDDSIETFCNIVDLPQVAKLSPCMARDFFESIISEKLALYFRVNPNSRACAISVPSSTKSKFPGKRLTRLAQKIIFDDYDPSIFNWLDALRDSILPSVGDRGLFLLYLAKAVRIEPEACVSINFLCSLLIVISEILEKFPGENGHGPGSADDEESIIREGLEEEIKVLQKEVGKFMNYVSPRSLLGSNFQTLLSIVKFFTVAEDSLTSPYSNSIDTCLMDKLKNNSLTVQQSLQIYKRYPHSNRDKSGYDSLYKVFEDALRTKALSAQERHELSNMLDFDQLPDKVVERLSQSFDLGYEPALVRRSMEILRQKCKNLSPKGKSNEEKERMLICLQILRSGILMVKQSDALLGTVRQLCERQGLSPPIFQDEVVSEARPTVDFDMFNVD